MSDLISRQAAIDVVEKWFGKIGLNPDICIDGRISLPSAQPEPININIEDFNNEDWERLKKEWGNTPITVLPSAQPEIIRCKDCKYRDENWRRVSVRRLPCMEVLAGSNWYCGSAERRTDE